MGVLVSTAQIYDAVFDDEALGELLSSIASSIGARSFCSTWIFADGAASWTADSGHWTRAQVELYARDYAFDDVWTAAQLKLWKPGRATNVAALVDGRAFERSRLKDEFLRTIGDDMRHLVAIGSDNQSGLGAISFQRGTASRGFDEAKVVRLDEIADHLARMLAIRSRFAALERRLEGQSALIDVVDLPVMLVQADLRLVECNVAANDLIVGGPFRLKDGKLRLARLFDQAALETAVARALDVHAPEASAIAIPGRDGGNMPFSIVAAPTQHGRRRAMLVGSLRRQQSRVAADADRLRLIYRLSPSEALLALSLADGATVAEISEQRGVALGTVRFQVKAIARKLDCRGQSDIVRIVNNLPPLRANG